MKKTAIVLLALIFAGLSIISCQKAKEPEAVKEVEKSEVAVKKDKPLQQPSEAEQVAKIETQSSQETQPLPIEQTANQETAQTTSTSGKSFEFKEPVLLWEMEFDPPIREISDQNSNGDFLAIQVKKEEGSGRPLMTKLLVIDRNGKTKREELLPEKKKITVPAEQLWTTASSEEELEQLKKARKPKEIQAWGREIYISGNGEYYATVMQYGNWYEFEYKDKNGKTLWKINPKDNYGFWKAFISYDGSRIVIIDVGGLSGGDVWEVLGQRVYFYDNTGKLLKDYDFGEKEDEWLGSEEGRNVVFSLNSKYIGMTRGWGNMPDKTVVLLDGGGNILWEKSFTRRHNIGEVTNAGNISISGYDNVALKYFIDHTGEMITTVEIRIDDAVRFAPSGTLLHAIRKVNEEKKEKDWSISKDRFHKYSISILEVPIEKIKPQKIKEDFFSYNVFSANSKYILADFADRTLLPSKGFYNHSIITVYNKDLKQLWTKEFTVKNSDERIFAKFLGLGDVFIIMDLNNTHIWIYGFRQEGRK